ncbi:MAG: hypothetical protein E7273_04175 [Pseudobutyrivibrio ruminis]|nr:hypothetical protein [Pseudobutyrivibrio ruminis]
MLVNFVGGWKLFFFILNGNVDKIDLIILGTILVVGLFIGVVSFPNNIGLEVDNYANFYMSRRFQPTYWQNIYTGALYGGCLMVLPHPIALVLIQWIFFWAVVSYIYLGIKSLYAGNIKYLALLLFLLPESYYLSYNSYRNNYYSVLLLLYISYLYFYVKNNSEQIISRKNILLFSLFTSFLMVWRSEGVLIGVGGLSVFLIAINLKKAKKKIYFGVLILTIISTIFFSQIQSIGAKKYYGQDYMIINTTQVLYGMLNNPNINLSYDGAEEDLESIEAIVPVEVLKEYGMTGYRNYNWNKGRADFNQTLATDKQAADYMKGYRHIVLKNLSIFLDIQANSFFHALQLDTNRPAYEYKGAHEVVLSSFAYGPHQAGFTELVETKYTNMWSQNSARIVLNAIVGDFIGIWREFILNSGLNSIAHAVIFLMLVIIAIRELLRLLEKGEYRFFSVYFVIAAFIVLAECMVIMIFMPVAKEAYLYPMLYSGYLVILFYSLERTRINSL